MAKTTKKVTRTSKKTSTKKTTTKKKAAGTTKKTTTKKKTKKKASTTKKAKKQTTATTVPDKPTESVAIKEPPVQATPFPKVSHNSPFSAGILDLPPANKPTSVTETPPDPKPPTPKPPAPVADVRPSEPPPPPPSGRSETAPDTREPGSIAEKRKKARRSRRRPSGKRSPDSPLPADKPETVEPKPSPTAGQQVKAIEETHIGDKPEEGAVRPAKKRRSGRRRRGAGRRAQLTEATTDRDQSAESPPETDATDPSKTSVVAKVDSFINKIDLDGAKANEAADRREDKPDAIETDTRRDRGPDRDRRPASLTPTPISSESREMLINVADPDECRIALISEGRLDELYLERATSASNVGNIYKGVITNVEPSIQAVFIDFGLPSHGFLHISDVHPQYFPNSKGEPELVGRKTPRRHRPPIQHCLKRGQEVLVQVIKEGIGTKGPTLTTYISVPGRFLVMMPGMDELGVSRKIEDEDQRRKLKDILGQLSLPSEMGFIVRTAGVDRTKRDLQRDLNYLSRLWKQVEKRLKEDPAPTEVYKESDLVIRTIRDVYDASLKKIIVDDPAVAARVREFLSIASPRSQDVVVDYTEPEPMFHRYGIESEIDKLHSRRVPLPCGGSLIIEQTEALVAIDVNSGRFRVPENAEETAYLVNVEAVDEIARQLRLRDLGGLIICDLIDMGLEKHRRAIEKRISDALRKHKERAKILNISLFGILEMTRQRQRPSFAKSMFRECPTCTGSGFVKATEAVALDVMRQIRLASQREGTVSVEVRVAMPVANDLLNRKRHQLTELERKTSQRIRIDGRPDHTIDQVIISCTDRRGREVIASALKRDIPQFDAGRRINNPKPSGSRSRGKRGGRSRRPTNTPPQPNNVRD